MPYPFFLVQHNLSFHTANVEALPIHAAVS